MGFCVSIGEYRNRLSNTEEINKELKSDIKELETRVRELEKIASAQTVKIENLSNTSVDIVERFSTEDGKASFDLQGVFKPKGKQ